MTSTNIAPGSCGTADLARAWAQGCRMQHAWPGLRVEYAWRPPFEGRAQTQANRLEVVFSSHAAAALEQHGRGYDVQVAPGALYFIGAEPTTLLRVREFSDTLEIYPDPPVFQAAAEEQGVGHFELAPTLGRHRAVHFDRDAAVLGWAHGLRRVCVGRAALSDVEASTLAHLLARHTVASQHGGRIMRKRATRLNGLRLAQVSEFIEANLHAPLSLEMLAACVHLSSFHFARCFKLATGLAPHQYVQARRMEWAKSQMVRGSASVTEVAAALGYDNFSHFRRKFLSQVGVLPGALRAATQGVHASMATGGGALAQGLHLYDMTRP